MEKNFYELTIEEQKNIYGGERVIVGYQILDNGTIIPIYANL